jgi:D-alanyl-D-alanine carboxypeptidase
VSNSSDLARWGFALFSGKVMPGACLNELVKGVPIDHGANGIQYGLGVGIYVRGRFGPVYGHGGWIPGYCSSLRYYPEHGVTVAFQINTDIGIADDSTPLMNEMESRLAEVVISANISRRQTAAENRHSAQCQEGEGRK